ARAGAFVHRRHLGRALHCRHLPGGRGARTGQRDDSQAERAHAGVGSRTAVADLPGHSRAPFDMIPANELETLRDWLRYTVSRMGETRLAFGHGSTEAYDEAAYLLLHALHLPLDRLEPFLDARLTQDERERLRDLFTRRIEERIPGAYLTHEAWLGGFRFYVDERVIIPRSFIAELIPGAMEPYVGPASNVETALDMCTGSGCLAILMAHAYPDRDIDAVA